MEGFTPEGLADAMPDGLYVVDLDRRITYWNESASRLTGYDRAEAVGRWCGDGLLDHVDASGERMCGTTCPLLATIADGQPRSARVHLHHKDGHLVPVRVAAAPLRDADGRVVGAVETFHENSGYVTTRRRLEVAEMLAQRDPLTGLGNRRHLDAALERRFRDRGGHGDAFGVLLVDLDHFKRVNDSFGHLEGDRVLGVVARSMEHAVRPGDDVVRYGGEEFVVVAGPLAHGELRALADRLLVVIRSSRYALPGEHVQTASVGAALVRPGDDAASLIARADARLLAAKRGGRDRAVVEDGPDLR